MIKKIFFIISTMSAINFNSHSKCDNSTRDDKLQKDKIEFVTIATIIVYDLFNAMQDLNRINKLGCKDAEAIKNSEAIEFIKNLALSSQLMSQLEFAENIENLSKNNNLKKVIENSSILKKIANIKFTIDSIIICANANKIAYYNQKFPKSLSKIRLSQYIWLVINKLAPYIGFALTKNTNQNYDASNCSNAFTNYQMIRALSNISEILRKVILNHLYMRKHKQSEVNN
ncbi:MAG: hypothetical protein M0R03_16660 [Novosphingobium sp.]|nr:hypothetical protein [Novosphingobium sp.]